MAIFFALISALAAFNWHVIRKAAAVIATQASGRAALEQQTREWHAFVRAVEGVMNAPAAPEATPVATTDQGEPKQ